MNANAKRFCGRRHIQVDGARATQRTPGGMDGHNHLSKEEAMPIEANEPPGSCANVRLSTRERQVAAALVQGESNKSIALSLGISQHTVRDHVSNLLRKFGVHSRVRLAAVLSRTETADDNDNASER